MYAAAGLGALAIYVGLPKQGVPARRALFALLVALALGGLVLLVVRMLGESGGKAVFGILAVLSVGGAIRVVTHPRPVYSALYFILVILSTAALVILVGAEFLGIALVIVYAGAILVTYVFVIMLAQESESASRFASVLDYDRSAREPLLASAAGFLLTATIGTVLVRRSESPLARDLAENSGDAASAGGENTLELGRLLMIEYAVSVEVAGLLLLVAMIGAIAIARKRIPHADEGAAGPAPGEIGKRVEPY